MKLQSIMSVFMGASLICAASCSDAESRANAVSLTLGGGEYYFASKRQVSNTGLPVLNVGFDFTPHWGVEGLFSFFNTNTHNSVDNGKRANGDLLLIDGVYHFSAYYHLEPFVLAGMGILFLNPNGTDAHNEGNVNIGAGAQFFIAKSLALRAEARDIYTIVGGKNDGMVDVGITYLWDM